MKRFLSVFLVATLLFTTLVANSGVSAVDHIVGSYRDNKNSYNPSVARNSFDAFGNGSVNAYSNFGYAGEYHDTETGFIYLRGRYYNPATGRFISEDPYWNVQNMIYGNASKDTVEPPKPNFGAIKQSTNLYA